MNLFFKQHKDFLLKILGALIFIFGFYFFHQNPQILKLNLKNTCQNPPLPDGAKKLVTKVIDGDTFLIEGGYSVRILGIDADEKEKTCFEAAKQRLEELILGKEVVLEKGKEDLDQHCRYLRYVILDGKNVGLELIKEGLVVARIDQKEKKYQKEFEEAEKEAREKKVGCKWSAKSTVNNFSSADNSKNAQQAKLYWQKLTSELTGLKVIEACQAKNYYGKEVIVEGKVVATFLSKKNNLFLNFGKPYPEQCFSVVIFNSDLSKFGESAEKIFEGKTVRVRGIIKEYQQKPEIILKDPNGIEIASEN